MKALLAVAIFVALALAAGAFAVLFPTIGAFTGNAIVGALGLALYLAPALIAWRVKHPSRNAITVLTVCAGWTIVGWALAMIWAVAFRPIPAALRRPERQPCPHCAEAILPAAKVCRYCGAGLRPGWAAGADIVILPRRTG